MKKRIIIVTLTLLVGIMMLAGCNTWKGAGKDIQETGEAMQHDD